MNINDAIRHGRELVEKLEPVGAGKNGRLHKPRSIYMKALAQSKADQDNRQYS